MKNRDLTSALGQLLTFLSVHQTGLACAAELLGGPSAAQRVRGLIEALSTAKPHLTRRIASCSFYNGCFASQMCRISTHRRRCTSRSSTLLIRPLPRSAC